MPLFQARVRNAQLGQELQLSSDLFTTNGTLCRASSLVASRTDAPHDLPQVKVGRGEVNTEPTHINPPGFILT